MARSHLIVPDPHAHPDFPQTRADYLAKLIIDLQPDVVVMMGDAADMHSLSSYDKGKRSFQGRSYKKDIDAHLEFQDRMWGPVKARKKKLPFRVALEGNHEYRIERALDLSPELEGTIGFNDLDFDSYYDAVVRYRGSTPGIIDVDGIKYSHYFVSGGMGRPLGGLHPASTLVSKGITSCTVGHNHLADWSCNTSVDGRKVMGCCAGVYQDYTPDWAGNSANFWWRGVVYKTAVENGEYDISFISLKSLENLYG